MKWLVAASLAALLEAGTITAVASAPSAPPPIQATVQQSGSCQMVHRGRWIRGGHIWHHRRWDCRWRRGVRRCRWRYW